MSSVYIGNLFTDEPKRDDYQKYCYEHHIYAIGWAIEMIPQTLNEYEKIAKGVNKWEKDVGLTKAITAIRQIKKGDLIWSRCRKTGKYWLGKATKNGEDLSAEDFHHIYDNKKNQTVYCLSVPLEKWKVYNMDQVPGVIISNFRRITIKYCKQSKYIINYCESLYNETKPARQNLNALKAFLSPDDEEDLLGLYLQKEKNYLIYPSTNKRGTAAYEYMLAKKNEDGSIQKAICQCKMENTDIELKDFDDYKDFEVYCVTDKGEVKLNGNKYEGQKYNNGKSIMYIKSLDELLNWANEEDNEGNKKNLDILPDRIRENLKITDF